MRYLPLLIAGNFSGTLSVVQYRARLRLTGLTIAPRQVPSLVAKEGHCSSDSLHVAATTSVVAITAPTAESHEQYTNGSSLFYVEARVPAALAASPGCTLAFSVSDNHTTFRAGDHAVSSIVGAWISPMGQLSKYHCVSCCDFTARVVCAAEVVHEVSVLYRPTICAPAFVAPLIQFLQVPPGNRAKYARRRLRHVPASNATPTTPSISHG